MNLGDALMLGTVLTYPSILFLCSVAHRHRVLSLTAVSILTNALLSTGWMIAQAVVMSTPLAMLQGSTWGVLGHIGVVGAVAMFL